MDGSPVVQGFALLTALAALFAAGGWYRVMGRGSPERIELAAVPTAGAFVLLALTLTLAAV